MGRGLAIPGVSQAAAELAAADFALGNAGAGLGAIAATLKGGLGTPSAFDSVTGATVADWSWSILTARVRRCHRLCHHVGPRGWSKPGELGGQTFPTAVTGHAFEVKTGMASNTTIGVVAARHRAEPRGPATPRDDEPRRLRSRHPAGPHPISDGDTLFAISTEAVPVAL